VLPTLTAPVIVAGVSARKENMGRSGAKLPGGGANVKKKNFAPRRRSVIKLPPALITLTVRQAVCVRRWWKMGPRFVRRKNLKFLVDLLINAPNIRKFAMRTQKQEKKPAPSLITAPARRSAQMESIVQQRGLVKMWHQKKQQQHYQQQQKKVLVLIVQKKM